MKKITIVILLIVLIISALPFGYAKQFSKTYDELKEIITIKSQNGTEMADFKLIENSGAGCEDCHALILITPKYDMETSSIGKFIKKFYNNKSKEINIANDMELYYIIDKKILVDVADYGTCSYEVNEYDNKAGRNITRKEEYKCQTGKHVEYRTEKTKEMKGIDDTLYAGQNYYLLIKGHKSPFESIEWIMSYANLEMQEWAWWLGLTCAYRLPLIVTENNNTALENYPVNASVNISVAGYSSSETRVLLEDDSNITWHNWSYSAPIAFTSGKNYTLFWLTNASASSITTNYLYLCSGATNNLKTIRSYVVNSSTKGYWALDESGANQTVIVDNSTSQNNGVINGTLIPVEGPYNYTALYFNGNLSNYTTIPHSATMDLNTQDYTLEAMINGTTVEDYQAIFATRSANGEDAWWIRANPTGKLECVLRQSANQISSSGAITITDSKWHHIACVRTGSTLTGYVDGKWDGSIGNANKDPDTTVSKVMGKLATAALYPFTGTVSQVRLTLGAIPSSQFVPRAIEPTISAGVIALKAVEPIIQNVTISPATAYTNSSLNCSANYGDDDNDKGNITITWYNGSAHYSNVTILNVINGVLISNQTLTGIQAKGETWNCTVNATDATGLASPPNSTTRSITNLPPTIGKVSITPKPANTTDTLACSATGYDLDLDALTMNFTWYNGSTYYNSSTFAVTDSQNKTYNLTAGLQARNEAWNCTVFVNDGTASSALNSTSITIDSLFSVISSSPANRTNTPDNTPDFIFNYTHNSSASGNCVLYVDNVNVGSNSSVISGKDTIITSSALADGLNKQWWVQCTQIEKYNTTISTIGIDTLYPVLTMESPKGEYYTYSTPYSVPLNFSYVEANPSVCLWNLNNLSNITSNATLLNWTSSNVGNPSNSFDNDWTTYSGVADSIGYLYVNYSIQDNSKGASLTYRGSSTGGGDAGVLTVSCYNYDTSAWSAISIYANGALANITKPVLLSCFANRNNLSLRITENGGGSGIARYYEGEITWHANLTALASCTNTTISISTTKNNTLYLYMNDTVEHVNFTSSGFSINLLNASHWASKGNVTESEEVIFTLQVNSTNITSINATFYYNNTAYNYGTRANTSTQANLTGIINIPLGRGNVSYYWNYTINSHNNVTQKYNLTIYKIDMGLANSTFTTRAINFSIYDEKNRSSIYGDFKGNFLIWTNDKNINKSVLFDISNKTNFTFGISPAWANYSYDLVGEYTSANYVTRFYYAENGTLDNATQEIELYDLDTASDTLFIQKIQDTNQFAVSNALINMQRYYPEIDDYRTVQISKTDDNGETSGFYQIETVLYRHIIIKRGVTLLTTERQVIVPKTTPYTLIFTIGESLIYSWEIFENLSLFDYYLKWNNVTKIATFYYNDISGLFSNASLFGYWDIPSKGEVLVCSKNSTASSATLICDLSAYSTGTFIVKAFITRAYPYYIASLRLIITSIQSDMGIVGLFLAFFIILVSGFAFIWHPIAGIWAINLSVIFVTLMGFAAFSPIFIFSMIFVSVILTIILKS